MKYQLEIITGDGPNVTVDLDAGRNVLSADTSHRYVLRLNSDGDPIVDDSVIIEVVRQGDDLVIEGLPEQQSLHITEYFSRCSDDQCSMQFGSDNDSGLMTITPADARWIQASTDGVALTLSSQLQPATPAPLANVPETTEPSNSTATSANASSVVAGSTESRGSSDSRSSAVLNAAVVPPSKESDPEDSGGISTGAILGGALGVAAIAGLASGGGSGSDPEPAPATQPSISSVNIEGSDQQVSSDEVTSNGAWQVNGTAAEATVVEISIRVSNNAGTQADIVSTDQFAVDANGNWSAAYSTSFFSGSQAGQITLTIIPIGSDGTRGSSTTRTYEFSGLTTAGPGDPSAPVVLASEDLLELDNAILTDEISATNTPDSSEQHSTDFGFSPYASTLQADARLPEL